MSEEYLDIVDKNGNPTGEFEKQAIKKETLQKVYFLTI